MPAVKLKDGSITYVRDAPTPERLRELGATVVSGSATRASAPAAVNPDDAEVERRYKVRKDMHGGKGTLGRSFASNLTFGLTDKLDAGVSAAFQTLGASGKTGRGRSFSDNYDINSRVQDRIRSDDANNSKVSNTVGMIAGMLANPLGATTGVASGLTKVAGKLGPSAVRGLTAARNSAPMRVAAKVGNSNIGLGARAGLNQGVVHGALNPGEGQSRLDSAINQGTAGAVYGGGGAAALGAGSRLAKVAYTDRKAGNAANVAYDRVADMIGRANRGGKGVTKRYTPQSAEREMRVRAARGEDPMLADLSDEMGATNAYLGTKPGLDARNEIVERARSRLDQAPMRAGKRINDAFGDGPDAYQLGKSVKEARRDHGAEGYAKGGVMDEPLIYSDELKKFLDEAPEITNKALRGGYEDMLNRREAPAQAGEGASTYLPNLRSLDYAIRRMNAEAGIAKRAGDLPNLQALEKESSELKRLVGEANPGRKQLVEEMEDFFRQERSIEIGQSFVKELNKNPRRFLDGMQSGKVKKEELIYGVRDALLNAEKPVAVLRAIMKNPHKREALKFALGGSNKELNKFDRFLRNELRREDIDRVTSSGSKTHMLRAAEKDLSPGGAVEQLFSKSVTGAAFGGAIGFGSGLLRGYDKLSRDLGSEAQEQIARILQGKGEGLSEGIAAAARRRALMEARMRAKSIQAGKLGAGVIRE